MIRVAWAFPVALVAVMGYQASQTATTLDKKAVAQQQVVESIQRWKQGVAAVQGAVDRWNAVYPTEAGIQDLVGVLDQLKLADAGLKTDADKVYVQKTDAVKHQDVPLGLTKVCLGSENGDGVTVQAADYRSLLAGLKVLANRPQIYIGSIAIGGEKAQASARLGEFCLMVRK